MAQHLVRADDDVLDRLVQRVADMEVPVGIGRAVMQREGRAALFFPQAVVDADLSQRASQSGSRLGRPARIGKSVFGRFNVDL
jgi:hypothetical protein